MINLKINFHGAVKNNCYKKFQLNEFFFFNCQILKLEFLDFFNNFQKKMMSRFFHPSSFKIIKPGIFWLHELSQILAIFENIYAEIRQNVPKNPGLMSYMYRGPANIRTGQKYEWLVQYYLFWFVFVGLVQSGPSKIFWPVLICAPCTPR